MGLQGQRVDARTAHLLLLVLLRAPAGGVRVGQVGRVARAARGGAARLRRALREDGGGHRGGARLGARAEGGLGDADAVDDLLYLLALHLVLNPLGEEEVAARRLG